MIGDSEPLLPGRDEPLIPLTDRRAPVLSRLRKRRSKRNNLGLHVGSKVGSLALFSDEEERIEEGQQIASNFRRGLAAELGVPEEAINPDLVEEFMAMFVALDESDIVVEDGENEEDVEVISEQGSGNEDDIEVEDESDEEGLFSSDSSG